MNYTQYLEKLVGKTVYIADNDDQPWITISVDDDDGDRGEVVAVGNDFCVLQYKRRLRKDVHRAVPLSMITVLSDA